MFGPVPQLTQVLVVQSVEGIVPEEKKKGFFSMTSYKGGFSKRQQRFFDKHPHPYVCRQFFPHSSSPQTRRVRSFHCLPDFLCLSPDDAQLAEEGQGDEGVGAFDGQVARDLLQLPQAGLQLGCYVVYGNRCSQ